MVKDNISSLNQKHTKSHTLVPTWYGGGRKYINFLNHLYFNYESYCLIIKINLSVFDHLKKSV